MKHMTKTKAMIIALIMACIWPVAALARETEMTVGDAIEYLQEKRGYSFVFESSDLDLGKTVKVDFDEPEIRTVIKQIISGQDVTFRLRNNKVIIKRNDARETAQETDAGKIDVGDRWSRTKL